MFIVYCDWKKIGIAVEEGIGYYEVPTLIITHSQVDMVTNFFQVYCSVLFFMLKENTGFGMVKTINFRSLLGF
jgi:hypothetical protein